MALAAIRVAVTGDVRDRTIPEMVSERSVFFPFNVPPALLSPKTLTSRCSEQVETSLFPPSQLLASVSPTSDVVDTALHTTLCPAFRIAADES